MCAMSRVDGVVWTPGLCGLPQGEGQDLETSIVREFGPKPAKLGAGVSRISGCSRDFISVQSASC